MGEDSRYPGANIVIFYQGEMPDANAADIGDGIVLAGQEFRGV